MKYSNSFNLFINEVSKLDEEVIKLGKLVKKLMNELTLPNQSQKHGITWENEVRERVFHLPKERNNTDIHDIPFEKNKLDPNENISIKATGSKTICCADILRFYNYDFSKKNTMIVIRYKQIGEQKIIQNIYEINYNIQCHKLLFGDLPETEIKKFIEGVKKIPTNVKGKDAIEIYNYKAIKDDLNEKYDFKIKINPKVDSKQSRVQCSISNFEEILEKYIVYKSSLENPNLIRGKEISISINSGTRKRNNKV